MRASHHALSLLLCAGFILPAGAGEPDPNRNATAPDPAAIRLAIQDLARRFGERYPNGNTYLARLNHIEAMPPGPDRLARLAQLRREALLANPLLDFDAVLLVRRDEQGNHRGTRSPDMPYGLPQNWQCDASLGRNKWDNQIVALEGFRSDRPIVRETYRPSRDVLIKHLDLHWNGRRFLFSSVGEDDLWHVYEMSIGGGTPRQVSPGDLDADCFDACYLPDGRILFASTLTGQGVPCVKGKDEVANLCIMNADGSGVRRLCFDQDQNWHPSVGNDGTVLFARWQYSDQAHFFARTVMKMNPDGTNQRDVYGSNSYWPTSLFFPRAIPGHPSQFVGIVSGHHGVPRMGELVIFDPQKGNREADGVVRRIPSRGQPVQPRKADRLVDKSWPKFLHPWPLSENYFLVSAQPGPEAPWGLYLADAFDNLVCIHAEPGQLLLEPVALTARPVPPVVPDRVDPTSRKAQLAIADIYEGEGLAGVPRGTVKSLRLHTFSFPVHRGHETNTIWEVGVYGPWDLHGVLGTVPVAEDGSVLCTIPANTPVALQPLDKHGNAVQVMRTWLTAMPGERLGCVGCHENGRLAPPPDVGSAMSGRPAEIERWSKRLRGFGFRRDVQPILERRCVGCHDGKDKGRPDLRDLPGQVPGKRSREGKKFSRAYLALQKYVYRPGPESAVPVLPPMEYYPENSELVQMLQKGHHGVRLSEEEWARLNLWIDLNIPYLGHWMERADRRGWSNRPIDPAPGIARRLDYLRRYANVEEHIDAAEPYEERTETIAFVSPEPEVPRPAAPANPAGWPMSPEEAARFQSAGRAEVRRSIHLPAGHPLELVWIPAGSFVMGSRSKSPDESPQAVATIDTGFWMSSSEIVNDWYKLFDPNHDSGEFNQMAQGQVSCESLDGNSVPAVRVSWQEAKAFCRWLSETTGERFDLPTEAQWEWACRAGSDEAFHFGPLGTDTTPFANVADKAFGRYYDTRGLNPRLFDDTCNDRRVGTSYALHGQTNAWGLRHMHGNAAEWTRSLYKPYPYDPTDGREDSQADGKRVVRGGSFADRPRRCTSSYRLGYRPWHGVHNVGFRVICLPDEPVE